MIPKSDRPSLVGDYRPIACCNVTYKVISKILASRLASTLGKIVDQAQSAFVEGRSMVENIHLAQEKFEKIHRIKKVSPRCILKIDLQKAFDSVSWGFLKSILEGLNFLGKFVSWVMECVTTTSYSISLNGSLHDMFEGKRGLRQGDPLSPFLFVLCIEYLSRSLNIAMSNPDFNFHPRC
ncbi:line-1 retrotransposable element orf2 protein [Phtheirospermum japonicum]|uniref:Line-1 retrotransposable element orf2 protein n=1 Tax=Phtheirospermum japonicum TaxID=374723 RepID=A0A830CEE9_9LAMI|nr:line-1 retrotransposable element orf2 protein [Phtheirospermum japonicum]